MHIRCELVIGFGHLFYSLSKGNPKIKDSENAHVIITDHFLYSKRSKLPDYLLEPYKMQYAHSVRSYVKNSLIKSIIEHVPLNIRKIFMNALQELSFANIHCWMKNDV
jgi:hypothetical protein